MKAQNIISRDLALKLFVYITLVFMVLYFWKSEYLQIPEVKSITNLVFSVLFLFLGFLGNALQWHMFLKKSNVRVTFSDALISIGISVFGKYVPGKVWAIMGRAEYISVKYNYPRSVVASHSMSSQIISLWTGLIIGIASLFFIHIPVEIYIMGLGLWLLFSLFLFTALFHRLLELIIEKLLKREIRFPQLNLFEIITVVPYFILTWLFWALGFYFFTVSMTNLSLPIMMGFGFVLAATFGIAFIIFPGGIGVREGILITYLKGFGLGFSVISTIAVASRLWFLAGEIFIFLVATGLYRYAAQNIKKTQHD